MGCNNTNVKEDIINKNELNDNKENILNNSNKKNKRNQEDIESNLDDLENNKRINDISKNLNQNLNPNINDLDNINKGDEKTILNFYTNKLIRPKIFEVPKIKYFNNFNNKGPEDKKPPDIRKLKDKK